MGSWCETCNSLLQDVTTATSRHYEPVVRLMAMAGQGQPEQFREIHKFCLCCGEDYRRAVSAWRSHQMEHPKILPSSRSSI